MKNKSRSSIFNYANRYNVDNKEFIASAFWNCDGAEIPRLPSGVILNPNTHSHYLSTAIISLPDINALIDTVAEHYGDPVIIMVVNIEDFTKFDEYFKKGDFYLPTFISSASQNVGLMIDNAVPAGYCLASNTRNAVFFNGTFIARIEDRSEGAILQFNNAVYQEPAHVQ